MLKKRVSLKDIAEKVGVSTALVSYVLNNKEKQARVGDAIAKRIRKVAAEMNYQPNLIARGLKFGKTNTIGLIVADISNPFFATIAKIIEVEAQKNGYTVLFGSSDEELDKSQNLINTFLNRRVDGLIITPVAGSQNQIAELKAKSVPFVLMDRGFNELKTNIVVSNNFEAAYNAVDLLIKNGYKKIGMISYDTPLTHMQDRVNGYKEALKANGIRFNNNYLKKIAYSSFQPDLDEAIHSLVASSNKVDALFFATNTISVQSLKIIHKMGIKVPSDLGIISFDDSDTFDFFYSSVTFIQQNVEMLSAKAVETLVNAITDSTLKPQKVVVPVSLVAGESSGKRKIGK